MHFLGRKRHIRKILTQISLRQQLANSSALLQGDVEVILGKWFALNPEKRKDIFLATKFGAMMTPEGFTFRGDPAYVSEACEKSLKRLNVETIDLWYPHRLDGSTPVELIVAEMVKLKE